MEDRQYNVSSSHPSKDSLAFPPLKGSRVLGLEQILLLPTLCPFAPPSFRAEVQVVGEVLPKSNLRARTIQSTYVTNTSIILKERAHLRAYQRGMRSREKGTGGKGAFCPHPTLSQH